MSEYPVKRAAVARISAGGHLIAAACPSSTINVYEIVKDAKGHGKLKDMSLQSQTSAGVRMTKQSSLSELDLPATHGAFPQVRSLHPKNETSPSEFHGCDVRCSCVERECLFTIVIPAPDSRCLVHTGAGSVQWIQNGTLLKDTKKGGLQAMHPWPAPQRADVAVWH